MCVCSWWHMLSKLGLLRLTWNLKHMAVGQNQCYDFGVGVPPILVYFSGDWGTGFCFMTTFLDKSHFGKTCLRKDPPQFPELVPLLFYFLAFLGFPFCFPRPGKKEDFLLGCDFSSHISCRKSKVEAMGLSPEEQQKALEQLRKHAASPSVPRAVSMLTW